MLTRANVWMVFGGLLTSLAVAAPGQEQPETAPDPIPIEAPELTPEEHEARLLPPIRLGFRVYQRQVKARVLSDVVIVPDGDSYLAALAGWRPEIRYPVLIDDGSLRSQQDIARFVRGFRPSRVWRWEDPTPDERSLRERVQALANDASPPVGEVAHRPPGVVVLSEGDPAWTAGAALAIAHGQILAWVAPGRDPNGGMKLAAVDELDRRITDACAASGHPWRELGDDIDAVTICLNLPGKVRVPRDDAGRVFMALTDLIGRHNDGTPTRPDRWAWAGQVFGSQSDAAYRAMCAIFIQPRNAWLVDGYPDTEPWNRWDATTSADILQTRGVNTIVTDDGDANPTTWRRIASGIGGVRTTKAGIGIDTDVILVNSKGMRTEFHLRNGRCLPGDIPILRTPAMVNFVHSWSANRQADRRTVAGRWLERGVYAYSGSVEEPYLTAFQPTPNVAFRMTHGVPWGAAVRIDDAPAGRIMVIGDPLITSFQQQQPRLNPTVTLQGAQNLKELQVAALKTEDFKAAIRALVLRGQDDNVARLALLLLRERPKDLTISSVGLAALSAARAGRVDVLVPLCERLQQENAMTGAIKDALWHTLWPVLQTLQNEELDILMESVRDDQVARDAVEVASAIRARRTEGEARAFLDRVRSQISDSKVRKAFDEAVRK